MEKIKRVYIFQPYKKEGNNTWYGIIKAGRQVVKKESLRTTSKKEAETWKQSEESKRFLPQEKPGSLVIKKFADAAEEYSKFLIGIYKNSPHTLIAYQNYMEKFKAFFGNKAIQDISVKDVQEFITFLSKDYSPKTIHEIFKFCKKILTRWRAYKYLQNNPFEDKDITLPKIVRGERPFWLQEEIKEILERKASSENRPFWAVMAYAGLRLAEAQKLTFEDLDFEANRITVLDGKGGKDRQVAMNPYLKGILLAEKQMYQSGPCFPLLPRSQDGCLKALKQALKGMVFKKEGPVTLHRFRHSFASNLIRAGANIKQVQSLLGHEDIRMTLDVYGHLIKEDLDDAVKLLHPGIEA